MYRRADPYLIKEKGIQEMGRYYVVKSGKRCGTLQKNYYSIKRESYKIS